MITVEIRDAKDASVGGAQVEIYCDQAGLDLLLKELGYLKAGSSHIHLMTPGWAGKQLGEKTYGDETQLVNHLRITMLPSSVAGGSS